VAFSPQANYTDRASAACRWTSCQLLRIEGVASWAQRIPTAVNLGFIDRSRYFSIQVAPQLSSRGWVDPVPDPLLLRKSGSAGNRTRDLWISSQELWPLDHRGGHILTQANTKSAQISERFSFCFRTWWWLLSPSRKTLRILSGVEYKFLPFKWAFNFLYKPVSTKILHTLHLLR
jgi:hypothetical protein